MRRKRLFVGFTAMVAMLTVVLSMTGTVSAQETLLLSFNYDNGDQPIAGLTIDGSGNLYGTTFYGGAEGNGMVFELSPGSGGWVETVLYSFTGNGPSPFFPNSSLIFDTAGNLYGTTFFGGAFGAGTVYELSPTTGGNWIERTLHSFGPNGGDGTYPHAHLMMDSSGNLYGTTGSGGAAGDGTVYELSPATGGGWTEKVLHSFRGADGQNPFSSLILDGSGNLYGTTASGGGSSACTDGCGTVFELIPSGGKWTVKLLRSFNNTDGANPYGTLIFDSNGNLYGTASQGGPGNTGNVFELTPTPSGAWKEKILHQFTSNGRDGINPSTNLIFGSSGNLYGTTPSGGARGQGTVFSLVPAAGGAWQERILYNFDSKDGNGSLPVPGLVIDGAGNLYGAAESGGGGSNPNCIGGCGAVFEIQR
jgi:uncharacterized repeat protein (TIGR03803 family)